MADLVEVFRSPHTPTAQLVRAALVAHGLDAHIVGDNLASMIGMGSRILPARILVPADQADEARAALAVMDAFADEAPPDDEPSHCPACGVEWEPGFEVCWQCQTELDGG